MKNDEVVQLLQHYRHDLMNRLQVIKGYASMKKTDHVNEKLNELIDDFNEERKLMSLNTPNFLLWLLQFNSFYENIRMTYKIHIENRCLIHLDNQLMKKSKTVVKTIESFGEHTELYTIHLELKKVSGEIHLYYIINGYFKDEKQLIMELNKNGKYIGKEGMDNQLILQLEIPNIKR
ncbi:MAG TPA: Spo0B domain-containing protein [Candidatus Avamphibacillus sp.]|nr:Spo0B domain-containing protein [Candidatus Avamphibacillus sp.]